MRWKAWWRWCKLNQINQSIKSNHVKRMTHKIRGTDQFPPCSKIFQLKIQILNLRHKDYFHKFSLIEANICFNCQAFIMLMCKLNLLVKSLYQPLPRLQQMLQIFSKQIHTLKIKIDWICLFICSFPNKCSNRSNIIKRSLYIRAFWTGLPYWWAKIWNE